MYKNAATRWLWVTYVTVVEKCRTNSCSFQSTQRKWRRPISVRINLSSVSKSHPTQPPIHVFLKNNKHTLETTLTKNVFAKKVNFCNVTSMFFFFYNTSEIYTHTKGCLTQSCQYAHRSTKSDLKSVSVRKITVNKRKDVVRQIWHQAAGGHCLSNHVGLSETVQ